MPPEVERNNVLKDLEAREKIITLPGGDEEREKQSNALLKEAESKQKINTDVLKIELLKIYKKIGKNVQ